MDPVEKIDVDRLQDWLELHPKVRESLEDVRFGARRPLGEAYGEMPEVAVDLLSTYAGQAADLAGWLVGAQINTDMNLRLQYLAGLALNRNFEPGTARRDPSLLQVPGQPLRGAPNSAWRP